MIESILQILTGNRQSITLVLKDHHSIDHFLFMLYVIVAYTGHQLFVSI